jgi:hypothetical protein
VVGETIKDVCLVLIMLVALNLQSPESNFDLIRVFTGKNVGTPPPLDDLRRLGSFTQIYQTFLSVSAAVKIGFVGFGALDGSVEHKVWITDYGISANQPDINPDNGVDSWTYGVGYRVGILMNKSVSQLKIGMAAFAADATLNNTNMFLQVITYGLPAAPTMPSSDLSRFDVEAYGKLISWQNDVSKYIQASRNELIPMLTHAAITADYDKYLQRFWPMLFALRRLASRQTFTQAVREADRFQGRGVDLFVLRSLYAKATGNSNYLTEGSQAESAPISDNASKYASTILSYYD